MSDPFGRQDRDLLGDTLCALAKTARDMLRGRTKEEVVHELAKVHHKITDLLATGNIRSCDQGNQWYILANAVQSRDWELVTLYAMHGLDLNVTGLHGFTVSHFVAGCGDNEAVSALAGLGVRFDVRDASRKTPTDWARENGHMETVDLIKKFSRVRLPPVSPLRGR
jgi:ankyrin repeat protein